MLREQTDKRQLQHHARSSTTRRPRWTSVLGNPRVKLVHYVDGKDVPIKKGPTAADIAGLDDDLLPGPSGRSPRCPLPPPGQLPHGLRKAQGRRQGARRSPTPTSPRSRATPGLVVQYFFFYYFNQFNDVHEGDWEGMQIAFDADSAAQALAGRAVPDRPLPTRRRRARRLGRRQGPEERDPSDRLSGGWVARHLLRRRDLHPERLARLGGGLR